MSEVEGQGEEAKEKEDMKKWKLLALVEEKPGDS